MGIVKYFLDLLWIFILSWILYGAYKGLGYFFDPDEFVFKFFVFVLISSLYLKKKDKDD